MDFVRKDVNVKIVKINKTLYNVNVHLYRCKTLRNKRLWHAHAKRPNAIKNIVVAMRMELNVANSVVVKIV